MWKVRCELLGSNVQTTLNVTNVIGDFLPIGTFIKDLPLGSKIKFSNGRRYVLMGKNLEGHAENSCTLVQERGTEFSEFGDNSRYDQSILHKELMPEYFLSLNLRERHYILEHEFTTVPIEPREDGDMSNYKLKSKFYIPSITEMGLSGVVMDTQINGNIIEGVNLGFTDDVSRIKFWDDTTHEQMYWLRSGVHTMNEWLDVAIVYYDGKIEISPPNISQMVITAVDVSGQFIVKQLDDGYWRYA